MINGKETGGATSDPYTRLVLQQGQTGYVRLLNAAYQWTRVRCSVRLRRRLSSLRANLGGRQNLALPVAAQGRYSYAQ